MKSCARRLSHWSQASDAAKSLTSSLHPLPLRPVPRLLVLVLMLVRMRVRRGLVLRRRTLMLLKLPPPPLALVPSGLHPWLALNPLSGLVSLYRAALLGGQPEARGVVVLAIASLLALGLGWRLFRRLEPGFPDDL